MIHNEEGFAWGSVQPANPAGGAAVGAGRPRGGDRGECGSGWARRRPRRGGRRPSLRGGRLQRRPDGARAAGCAPGPKSQPESRLVFGAASLPRAVLVGGPGMHQILSPLKRWHLGTFGHAVPLLVGFQLRPPPQPPPPLPCPSAPGASPEGGCFGLSYVTSGPSLPFSPSCPSTEGPSHVTEGVLAQRGWGDHASARPRVWGLAEAQGLLL